MNVLEITLKGEKSSDNNLKMTLRDKYRSVCRKTKRFTRGTLEGLVYALIMPTYNRLDHEYKIKKNNYSDAGFMVGSSLNILAQTGAYCLTENLWAFAPLVVGNVASGVYELGRIYLGKR